MDGRQATKQGKGQAMNKKHKPDSPQRQRSCESVALAGASQDDVEILRHPRSGKMYKNVALTPQLLINIALNGYRNHFASITGLK